MSYFYTLAQISIRVVSAVAMNSSSVRITWTPLNQPEVDHYTVHYIRVGSGRSSQIGSETVTFPLSASSGVVSGLQEGQQYQFSVSVSLTVNGQTYTSAPGEPVTAMTGAFCILLCVIVDL